jgi:cytolysin-activating lysine-acyltransferase
MSAKVDTAGKELPPGETPSAEKLRVYGDMAFLAFRSQRHARMTVNTLRTYFEPAIELGQFRIFRFDDIPRGMYTWAWLGAEGERRLIQGEALRPFDWNSGPRLWIIDLIAPYRGLTSGIARWIMQPGNLTETEFLFRRVAGENRTRRIVHVDFRQERLSRIMTDEEYLSIIS